MNYASCFFLPVFLFCFRIFSRPTLYLVPKSPWSPPTWDCSSVFPYHSWPWWYGCLLASYFLGCHSLFLCSSWLYWSYTSIWQKYHESTIVSLLVHYLRRYLVSAYLTTLDVTLDQSVTVMSTRLLQWKVTISAFVFNYYLRSETLLTSCFSRHFCLDFIIHQWSVPTQLLLWCLHNDNFVFYPIDYNSILSFILMLKLF